MDGDETISTSCSDPAVAFPPSNSVLQQLMVPPWALIRARNPKFVSAISCLLLEKNCGAKIHRWQMIRIKLSMKINTTNLVQQLWLILDKINSNWIPSNRKSVLQLIAPPHKWTRSSFQPPFELRPCSPALKKPTNQDRPSFLGPFLSFSFRILILPRTIHPILIFEWFRECGIVFPCWFFQFLLIRASFVLGFSFLFDVN